MSLLPWSVNPNNPYQVTEDDKDFLTLAANLNVDYNQLRAANPYVQSLSQGQFINIPNLSPSSPHPNQFLQFPNGTMYTPPAVKKPPLAGTSFSGWNAQSTKTVANALSPTLGMTLYQNSERGMTPVPPAASLTGSFMPGGQNTPQAQAAVIANMLNQSGKVPNVPITGQQMKILVEQYGANPSLLNASHTFDPKTQTYKPKQTANATANPDVTDFSLTAAAQYNAQNNIPYMEQYRYDPKTKSMMKIKDILRKYGTLDDPRGKRQKERRNKQTNFVRKEAPSTTLNLVLGG